ncbi:hypothetical protein OUZ56_020393 [Daphnia magna]|uniref:Uncharacterized protein n=1 Tax=Daphnia magna TaxID=35525 RepID=A0ABQ9ZEC9_9CRUS|nr:hypothetical protein OUZ56_020393 [Daphnia magna]
MAFYDVVEYRLILLLPLQGCYWNTKLQTHEFEEQKQTKEFEIIDHYNSKLREPAQFTARLDQEPYK